MDVAAYLATDEAYFSADAIVYFLASSILFLTTEEGLTFLFLIWFTVFLLKIMECKISASYLSVISPFDLSITADMK